MEREKLVDKGNGFVVYFNNSKGNKVYVYDTLQEGFSGYYEPENTRDGHYRIEIEGENETYYIDLV